jgi:hypothetical protein
MDNPPVIKTPANFNSEFREVIEVQIPTLAHSFFSYKWHNTRILYFTIYNSKTPCSNAVFAF